MPPNNENNLEQVPWYKNGDTLSGYAGLASTLVSAAMLPSQLKTAKLQQKSLAHNLATAKQEQQFRTTARNNMNSMLSPSTTNSALATSQALQKPIVG